jgi:hypothetical protein
MHGATRISWNFTILGSFLANSNPRLPSSRTFFRIMFACVGANVDILFIQIHLAFIEIYKQTLKLIKYYFHLNIEDFEEIAPHRGCHVSTTPEGTFLGQTDWRVYVRVRPPGLGCACVREKKRKKSSPVDSFTQMRRHDRRTDLDELTSSRI